MEYQFISCFSCVVFSQLFAYVIISYCIDMIIIHKGNYIVQTTVINSSYKLISKLTTMMCARYFWLGLIFNMVMQYSFSKEQKPTLYIYTLIDENSWSSKVSDRAGELAVEMVNNQSDLLPDYHLKLCRGRSGCNVPSGPTQWLIQDVLQRKGDEARPVLGIVGPTCSSSVALLGSLVSRDEVALLNIHMSAPDQENYHNSFGVLGSYVSLLHSAIQLIRLNNWSSVSVLYDNSILYQSSTLYNLDQSLREVCIIHEFFISASHLHVPFPKIQKIVQNHYHVRGESLDS